MASLLSPLKTIPFSFQVPFSPQSSLSLFSIKDYKYIFSLINYWEKNVSIQLVCSLLEFIFYDNNEDEIPIGHFNYLRFLSRKNIMIEKKDSKKICKSGDC